MNRDGQLSTHFRTEPLDQIPVGLLRIATDKSITYLNRAAREMLGPTVEVGTSISDIAMDEGSRHRLQAELRDRYKRGRASTYELELVGEGGTRVVLEVSGVPEYDENGVLTGSIGFIRDRSVDLANMAIHRAIERSAGWQELLEGVAQEVRRVIPFDSFVVTLLSEKRRHLRSFFEHPPYRKVSPLKWWPMPPFVEGMLASLETSSVNVCEMFAAPPYKELAENDPATREFLARGFTHLARLPIYRNKSLIAIVLLYRKEGGAFSERDLGRLEQLPLGEAVNIALTLDKKGEMRFWLDLIRELGQFESNADGLRRHLVARLRDNYGWQHVSLFRIDSDNEVFRLVCQSLSDVSILPNDYRQPFATGVLDRVRTTRKPVVIGDVTKGEFKDMYVPGIVDPRSEMCLPVPGTKMRWILNVESQMADAFADEEQRAVGLLLGVVGAILDRVATSELQSAIFGAVADGVILTSLEGVIEDVNPAAVRMLGGGGRELRGRRLGGFLRPRSDKTPVKEFQQDIMSAPRVPSSVLKLRALDGSEREVLISGAALPHELGGKVYIASDLTYPRKVEEMEVLRQVFQKVAAELRVPIALASGMLADVKGNSSDDLEVAAKALAQLRKADLPLQRILRLATSDEKDKLALAPLDLVELLGRIKDELPRSQADELMIRSANGELQVWAAASELTFCLQSVVAFLLRLKAQSDIVTAKVSRRGNQATVTLGLAQAGGKSESRLSASEFESGMREFALAERAIVRLVERMDGRFGATRSGKPHFEIRLKAAEDRHERMAAAGT